MALQEKIRKAFDRITARGAEPTVAGVASMAGVSWPTAKKHLENLGISCGRAMLPAETREHILAAAMQEFGSKGFIGGSLEAIAAQAGVTKGAIYAHFKSKEHLFTALMEIQVEDENDAIEEEIAQALAEGGDTEAFCVALLEAQLKRLAANPIAARMCIESFLVTARNGEVDVIRHLQARMSERCARSINDLARRGYIDAGADLDGVHLMWCSMIEGLIMRLAADPERFDVAAVARKFGRILAHGVSPRADRAVRAA